MAIIHYRELDQHLKQWSRERRESIASVFLLFGEEVIYKNALERLLDLLVPGSERQFNYEPLEGLEENVIQAIQCMNTYSLLKHTKAVGLLDTHIFHSGATGSDEPKSTNTAGRGVDALTEAVADGFPQGHHLIITAETVDKRRRLFKVLSENGIVVDCSVPKGDRRVDRQAQEAVLSEKSQKILAENEKTMNRAAFAALCEMTGFDLRTFLNNLDKLIDFSGDRREITVEDIEFVLERTKKDPVYEFTNALAARNMERALFFLKSLLSDDFHPLQIMTAMINQIRRLLLLRIFIEERVTDIWRSDMPYQIFQKQIMPIAQEHDQNLRLQAKAWDEILNPDQDSGQVKKKKKMQKAETDLLVAPNPNSPYPIYKLLQRATRFSKEDLLRALETLSRADMLLKSSGHSPRSVLENAIFNICGRKRGQA